ncbi:MAG: phosphatidylglycerol lysyltransferase domain-containing protein [Oscillospiraceae bacterium]
MAGGQFPGIFAFTSCRGTFDYIYSSEELQNLPGKKFQKKRNHVSRFLREHPDFVFEPITPENLEEVRAFNNAWSQLYGNSQLPESKRSTLLLRWA